MRGILKAIVILILTPLFFAVFLAMLLLLAVIGAVLGFIDFLCSKKISGNEEIKKVVEEEKQKIGIPRSVSIAVRNNPKYDFSIFGGYGGKTQELGENKYLVSLGYATNRRTVAHEIFHVYRYLAVQDKGGLYWYEEILARIYELFRINLSFKKI